MIARKEYRKILRERHLLSSGKTNRSIRKARRRDSITASVFMFAPLAVITIFVFAAFAIAIVLSFYKGRLDPTFEDLEFNGWKNWDLLFNESKDIFVKAIKNTFIFAGVTTAFNIVGALIISSVLNSDKIKRKNIFMTIYFFPQVTSGIASAIIFVKLTGPSSLFGLDIVKEPDQALWVMIITSVWAGISGGMITFNTAFSGIGKSQYEAASLDGASTLRKFWNITIPSLGQILAYSIITSIIGGMGVFDQAYILNMNGASPDSVMTWSLLGYARIIGLADGGAGFSNNVGLGMVTLVTLGITIFVLTRIANIIQPMDRK